MAEDLLTPSNTLVKVRWQEPYASEGLNKKLNGVVPHGVIRGGRLGTSALDSTVVVEADPDTGDSIYSVVDANGHQLTFRQVGNVSLDLDIGTLPGTTAYIGLDVTYSTGAATVVKWKGYSAAEIDADPTIVCLGSADVPAVAAVIPASDIYGDRRTDGGLNISGGMKPWRQVILNPSFEGHEVTCDVAVNVTDELLGWRLSAPLNGEWHVLTPSSTPAANPRTGFNNIILDGAGAGSHSCYLLCDRGVRVTPGQMVRASVWIRGDSVTMGGGALGYVEVQLEVRGWNGSSIATLSFQADGTTITGTFDYFELAETFKMPANAAYVSPRIYVNETVSLSGDIGIDDFRMWIEPGPFDGDYDQETDVFGSDLTTPRMTVTPYFNQLAVTNPQTIAERAIRLLCESANPSSLEYQWGPVRDAVTSWLMSLPKGGLSLGKDLITSAAEAIFPRLSSNVADFNNSRYTLLWELENERVVNNTGNIRIYSSGLTQPYVYSTVFLGASITVTINARWTGTQWEKDLARDSVRYDLNGSGFAYWERDISAASPWIDDDWDSRYTTVDSFSYVMFRRHNFAKAWMELIDPTFVFTSTTTDSDGSNPAYSVSVGPNNFVAKSMIKAWSYFEVNSAGNLATIDGLNLTPGTPTSTGVPFTIGHDMDVTSYSVVTTVECPPTQQALLSLQPHTLTLGTFDTTLLATTINSPSNTSVFDVSLLTTTARFFVQVFGRQDS